MISRFSVSKPFTIFVAVVIVLIFGVVALTRMTPDLFPNMNAPVAIVLTADPGASAEEAEREITEPLEQQLATLPNVDQLSSVSADNYSYISLVFTDDVNMDAISVDIRDKVEQIKDTLPEGASNPIVMKINLNMIPVAVAAVSMKDKDAAEVSSFTRDKLLTPLEGTEGVASVAAMGMIDDGLQIVLDQEKIDALNSDIRAAINDEINDGKSKVRRGINKAQSGADQIESGENKVTRGESKAEKKLTKVERKLLRQKAKLEAQKSTLQAQKDQLLAMRDDLPDLEALAQAAEEAIASGNPEAAESMLAQAGFSSMDELYGTIEMLQNPDFTEIDSGIEQIDQAVSKIEAGLAKIEAQRSSVSFSLGTTYSDLSSAKTAVRLGKLSRQFRPSRSCRNIS